MHLLLPNTSLRQKRNDIGTPVSPGRMNDAIQMQYPEQDAGVNFLTLLDNDIRRHHIGTRRGRDYVLSTGRRVSFGREEAPPIGG